MVDRHVNRLILAPSSSARWGRCGNYAVNQRKSTKILEQKHVTEADIKKGEFNNGEHVFIELEPGQWQTVSCRLPNGKYVTFAFCPGSNDNPTELECVDIHATVGRHWTDEHTAGRDHWQQHLVGFSKGGTTFDTRKIKQTTSLATLLLHKNYHAAKPEVVSHHKPVDAQVKQETL
jgi:hypothetical protein